MGIIMGFLILIGSIVIGIIGMYFFNKLMDFIEVKEVKSPIDKLNFIREKIKKLEGENDEKN